MSTVIFSQILMRTFQNKLKGTNFSISPITVDIVESLNRVNSQLKEDYISDAKDFIANKIPDMSFSLAVKYKGNTVLLAGIVTAKGHHGYMWNYIDKSIEALARRPREFKYLIDSINEYLDLTGYRKIYVAVSKDEPVALKFAKLFNFKDMGILPYEVNGIPFLYHERTQKTLDKSGK